LTEVLTPSLAERVNLRLRLEGGRSPEATLPKVDAGILLDVIDAVLSIERLNDGDLFDLDLVLEEGGSAYQIPAGADGLEHRVDPPVTRGFRSAVDRALSVGRQDAARYLGDAWGHIYGLHPKPDMAYSDAVKAVEAVAIPRIVPADPLPTLGKVLSCLRQGAAKWELVIAAKDGCPATIEPLVEALSLLWHGHRDRHPGGPTSAPVTQDAAEAAVHLAATLVQWFTTGAVRPRGSAGSATASTPD
jgi:hypothetical protein